MSTLLLGRMVRSTLGRTLSSCFLKLSRDGEALCEWDRLSVSQSLQL
jgi:hypothetical protein